MFVTSVGSIREWHAAEGWGVVDSDDTPGGCWVHFSLVAVDGYVEFRPGDRVRFTFESPGQDGWPFRAVRLWPDGREPVDRPGSGAAGSAYSSSLSLRFDEPDA